MPHLKTATPLPLEDLCLTVVVRCLETDLVLCEVAKNLGPTSLLLRRIDLGLPQIAKELSDYLSFLPGTLSEMVRQKITTRVIKKYTNTLSARSQNRDTPPFNNLSLHTMTLRLLEIILDEGLQSFDLSELAPVTRPESLRPAKGDPELWEVVLNRCTGLRKFSLPPALSSTFGTELNFFVKSLASQCNQLTELVLKDAIQDGKVLSALGAYCPSLRLLDVTGSFITCTDVLYLVFPDLKEEDCVTNCHPKGKKNGMPLTLPSGLKESRLCPRLRTFIVSDTKVRSLGVYYALKYLPNLESLGVCYNIAGGIKRHVIDGFCSFKLKQAYTRGLPKDKIVLVCSACPNLETLCVSSGFNTQFSFKLRHISKVHFLKFLTLESFSSLDLTELRYVSQLTELKVPDVDIGHVAEACPLLKRLVITNEPKKTFKLSGDRSQLSLFSHLQELQVDSPMSANIAEFILTEATFLKTVKLVRVKKLTDQMLARWLEINSLQFLETFILTYAHLTVASVSLLLIHCQNLSTIGRLSGWDIRSWESRRLQKAWIGYDVNLILFSHKQEDVKQIIDATASSDEEKEWA